MSTIFTDAEHTSEKIKRGIAKAGGPSVKVKNGHGGVGGASVQM